MSGLVMVRLGRDVVVVGTDQIRPALAATGLDEHSRQWSGFYYSYPDGWSLHKDGTAEYSSPSGEGLPAVLFADVTARPAVTR